MRLGIQVLSGGPAGTHHTFGPAPVSVGRAPESGLRFDAERDLAVSSRHALLYQEEGRWYVRDLESRNGTYVNGRRIADARGLRDGDRIAFGTGGPEVRVEIATPAGAAAAGPPDPARTLWISTAVVGVLLAVIAFLLITGERRQSQWDEERAALMGRLDSLLAVGDAAVRSLQGERQVLADALGGAQDELRSARADLNRAIATGDETLVSSLRRDLQARTAALERQQLAASLDFDAIESTNRRAVALIYVEDDQGTVSTGTGFAVRPDALLVTARHVLTGPGDDRQPRRIGVQFTDSEQVFPARMVASATDADVAILRVSNIVGEVPVIQGFNLRPDTLGTGVPVAYIGFPLGGAPEVPGTTANLARPIVAAGIVDRWANDRIAIQGRGAAGASGSPIFDAAGRTVGLLFGGVRSAEEEMIYGVPSIVIARTLEQVK